MGCYHLTMAHAIRLAITSRDNVYNAFQVPLKKRIAFKEFSRSLRSSTDPVTTVLFGNSMNLSLKEAIYCTPINFLKYNFFIGLLTPRIAVVTRAVLLTGKRPLPMGKKKCV